MKTTNFKEMGMFPKGKMRNICLAAVLSFAGTASPLAAQDDLQPITVSGRVGVVSDLRDRGISLSDKDFSPTATLTFDHESGLYAGVFGAANLETAFGGDSETEFFAGYAFASGAYVIDLSAELDVFYGDSTRSFEEFKARVSRDFGLAYIRLGAAYAPSGRWFTPNRESFYLQTDLEIPIPTLPQATLITRFGYDFRQHRSNVTDWAVGLSYFMGDIEFSLTLEDSSQNGRLGETAVVGGLRFFF